VDAGALERLEGLCEDLASKLASGPAKASPSWREVAESVRKLPEQERDALADMVLLDGHRAFVQRRYIGVEEFQRLLREFAGDQTVARKKLISHLREEFRRRGIDMSCDTIEERFRARPTVRSMPYCVKHILRNLGEEFRTGLIPIEKLVGNEEPDVWLERAQKRLRFRSQSAMHKAIAAATGIRYDSVHKALSGRRKAKRIQAAIKTCLDGWLQKAEHGEEPDIDERYQGVPVEEMCELLPALLFHNDGLLKFAPLRVYRVARQLAQEAPLAPPRQPAAPPRRPVDRVQQLAREAARALDRWRRCKDDLELEREFKDLRRELIVRLKERRGRRRTAAAARAAFA